MRTTRLIPLTALALALAAIAPPALAKTPVDQPEIRRTATVDLAGAGWTGRLSVGLATTGVGKARTTKPMPLELLLEREDCTLAGCVVTTVTAAPGAMAMPRMAAGFTSLAVGPTLIGVVVRRSAPGGPSMEHTTTLSIDLQARRTGDLSRVTALRQEPSGETLTISLSAPISGTLAIGDDSLAATGTAVKASVVR